MDIKLLIVFLKDSPYFKRRYQFMFSQQKQIELQLYYEMARGTLPPTRLTNA